MTRIDRDLTGHESNAGRTSFRVAIDPYREIRADNPLRGSFSPPLDPITKLVLRCQIASISSVIDRVKKGISQTSGRAHYQFAAAAAFVLCFAIVLDSFNRTDTFTGFPATDTPTHFPSGPTAEVTSFSPKAIPDAPLGAVENQLVQIDNRELTTQAIGWESQASKAEQTEGETVLQNGRDATSSKTISAKLEGQVSRRSLDRPEHAREVQKQLTVLGYFAGPAVGMWGPRSREALRAFRKANLLPANAAWDEETETVLFSIEAKPASFAGTWAAEGESCISFPTLLQTSGAKAGDTSCVFSNVKRSAASWSVLAICADTRERWEARVRLLLDGKKLTWTSQRGSQTYTRCESDVTIAHAR